MDHSETRRGQPCWYKKDDVGLIAINDSIMIENSIFVILKKHFADQPYYVELIELFHEAMMITTIGQSMDLQTANKSVTAFTMDRYKSIVNHKTSFYTFYLPVAIAMRMAGLVNILRIFLFIILIVVVFLCFCADTLTLKCSGRQKQFYWKWAISFKSKMIF